MGLKEYKSKRNFGKTDEPSGSDKKGSGPLHFCVQKHAARRLHYDFRLEYKGVLLSWAVPKGPSLDPQDKRLAMKVEDHPLEYQYFEGTIPKGSYGAGKVEIWDHGYFYMPNATTRQEVEKKLAKGLQEGHFNFIVSGDKLNGEFVFQKIKKDPEDNSWLLIKKQDASAASLQVMEMDASEQKVPGKAGKMPEFVNPMLATLVKEPFDSEDWLFEIKWDGYRALAFIDHGDVKLKSRSNNLLNEKFYEIVNNLKKLDNQIIFDGELVVVDSEGRSRFHLMQNYQKNKAGNLFYYIFDLLYKDGRDLREVPLIERKEILKEFLKGLKKLPLIRYSGHIVNDGKAFFREAAKRQLEGIIGKKLASTYQSRRSQEWLKIKTTLRQEVVIGGFTDPKGSRKKLGALLVGVYDDENELNFVGHVGDGFDSSLLDEVYKQLKPLAQKKSPFKNPPKPNADVTWVKPKLVCEVSFAEWTEDNSLRQPIFQGLRSDKDPKSIRKEIAAPTSEITHEKVQQKTPSKDKKKTLSLTNLDKIYWPEEKYTKGDLLQYYESISSYILPYLKGRPIVLYRFPEGVAGKSFYQKDIDFPHPDWVETFPIQHDGKEIKYLLINDLQSLLFTINLGSIDIHPFMSTIKSLKNPDYCVIDLDPHEVSFDKVVEAALIAHEILDEIGVKNFCKTSGGKGLHLFIPLHGKYDYDQSKQFAELICYYVHQRLPAFTSLERDPKKRPKKIYLDFLQNRFSQTIVAPYAVRPRPHALVSTPLKWEEVTKDLDPKEFNIKNISSRLKKIGDIFKPILGAGINIKTALMRLQKNFKMEG